MREYDFDPKESYLPKHIKRYENKLNNALKSNPSKTTPSRGEKTNNATMTIIDIIEQIPKTLFNIKKYIVYLINKKRKKHTRIFDIVIDDHKLEFFSNKEIKVYIKNNIIQDFSFDRIISDEHINHIAKIDYSISNIKYLDLTVKAYYIYNYIKYGEDYIHAAKYIIDKCIDNDMNFKFNLLLYDENTEPKYAYEDQTQPNIEISTKKFLISKNYNDMSNSYVKITVDKKRIAQLDKLTLSIQLDNVKEQTFISNKLKGHIAETLIKIHKYNEYISNKDDYDYIENLIDVFESIPDKSMLEVQPNKNLVTTVPNIRITDI